MTQLKMAIKTAMDDIRDAEMYIEYAEQCKAINDDTGKRMYIEKAETRIKSSFTVSHENIARLVPKNNSSEKECFEELFNELHDEHKCKHEQIKNKIESLKK